MLTKASRVLEVRDELRLFWQGKDVFTEVQQLTGTVARIAPGRITKRFEINGFAYYCKLHTGVGWWEIIKNLLCLRMPIIGARNEWQALNRLASVGVHSLDPVVYGARGLNPARQLSFIVTRELIGTQQLDHYVLARIQTQQFSFIEKQVLLREVARIARQIHVNGINHRDLYLCHFLLDETYIGAEWNKDTRPCIYLIDLHRAQLRERVPNRWLIKDLASLYFSACDFGLTRYDCYRFLRYYFDRSLREVFKNHSHLFGPIERRAQKFYLREQRLKAQGKRD